MSKERIIGVLVLMFSVILLASSCSKEEENNNSTPTNEEVNNSSSTNNEEGNSNSTNNNESNNSTPTNNDNYYVKYEVLNGSQQSYGTRTDRTVTFKDVDKEVKFEITYVPWEGTYGPFKKGDKVYMRFSSVGKYNATGRLSVSKNKEAFTIKDEIWNSESGKLEYTIDF